MRKTFQKLMAEYGVIAVIVYFTIFFGTLIAAWAAIQRGVNLAALATRFGLSSSGIVANLGAHFGKGLVELCQHDRIVQRAAEGGVADLEGR